MEVNVIEMLIVREFHSIYIALAVFGFLVAILDEAAGELPKRLDNFLAAVFIVWTLWVIREHVERGYVWQSGKPWVVRDGTTIVVVGLTCILALAAGTIAGRVLAGIVKIIVAIANLISYIGEATATFVWRWVLDPLVQLVAFAIRHVLRLTRKFRRKHQAA